MLSNRGVGGLAQGLISGNMMLGIQPQSSN